jgi:hypothetical protein
MSETGVKMIPPPERLIPDLHASMKRAIDTLPPGQRGAIVAVGTERGVNAAVVAKVGDGWQVQSWIGKEWGGAVQGGAAVVKSW